MIEVIDRIPTYPGRVKMTPVAGQENTYDMVRADVPIEPGTPINKALFDSYAVKINAAVQRIDDKLFEMSNRVRIGGLADGTIFGLYENGVLVPFIKLSNISSEKVLVVRKNCVIADVVMNEGETYYTNCRADVWLNGEYIQMLDVATQSLLSDAIIAVENQYGSTNIHRKVFLLSMSEYGASYFSAVDRRIALLNGTPTKHWTRNFGTTVSNSWTYVTETGAFGAAARQTIAGIRPAMTLPVDYEVTVGLPNTANTVATAEVI